MNFSIPQSLRGLFYSVTTLVGFVVVYLLVNVALIDAARDARAFQQQVLVQTAEGNFSRPDADYAAVIQSFDSPLQIGEETLPINSLEEFVSPAPVDLADVIEHLEMADYDLARTNFAQALSLVQATVERKESLVITLQLVVAIMVILFYAAVVFQMFRKADTADTTRVQAREESEGIMSTISEGLFLMKSDYEIGIEQSASLKEMFRYEQDLQGNFFDFIGDYVTPNTVQIAKDFIELLFGDRVKEKLIADLNPLNEVEINILRRDGSYEHRYLNFSFKRVMNGDQLSHLLCSVTDITREVELARELANVQEEQEAQLDLLMSVLHVDPRELGNFFTMADGVLKEINTTLEQHSAIHEKEKHSDSAIRGKLKDISAIAHRLKGDAAILQLSKFEFGVHDMEEEIKTLQGTRNTLDGKSLLPLVTKLRELFGELENMRSLVDKFASVVAAQPEEASLPADDAPQLTNSVNEPLSSAETIAMQETVVLPTAEAGGVGSDEKGAESFADQLRDLATIAAKRQGKEVALDVSIGDLPDEPYTRKAVKDIVIQFVRNAVVHGVEDSNTRKERNKPEQGRIEVKLRRVETGYSMSVLDDGAGLDVATIAEKGKALGLVSAEQKVDERLAMNLIFKSGFSSRQGSDLDGGRGVGLDVVMRLVKGLDGKIALKNDAGKQCKFSVLIPA